MNIKDKIEEFLNEGVFHDYKGGKSPVKEVKFTDNEKFTTKAGNSQRKREKIQAIKDQYKKSSENIKAKIKQSKSFIEKDNLRKELERLRKNRDNEIGNLK